MDDIDVDIDTDTQIGSKKFQYAPRAIHASLFCSLWFRVGGQSNSNIPASTIATPGLQVWYIHVYIYICIYTRI